MMDRSKAALALADAEVIPYREGPLAALKEFERECLSHDIPVLLAKPPPKECCQSGGCQCGGRMQLCAREEDIPRIEEIFRAEWLAQASQTLGEGLVQLKAPEEVAEGEEPPCPACGTAAPLKDGACSDCGLQLE